MKVDDPLHATQVHGCCGLWGVVAVAFFSNKKGILYGAEGSGQFLGVQLLGAVTIMAWIGIVSFLFFYPMMRLKLLRLDTKHEILGGDIYYFAPI